MSRLTVVFDLDGTLVDTAPDLADTLNVMLRREGIPELPYEAARNAVGGGARKMIERGLAEAGKAAPDDLVQRMFEGFIAHYSEHIADRSRPFPGLDGALRALEERGCILAVCTNKLERLSRLLLDALAMTPRFAAICGQDTFGVHKPDPEVLRRTVAAAGGLLQHAVMVGDSITDIDTARAAGIPSIAVDFGYTEIPVRKLGPDRVISHFDELADAVFGLGAGAR